MQRQIPLERFSHTNSFHTKEPRRRWRLFRPRSSTLLALNLGAKLKMLRAPRFVSSDTLATITKTKTQMIVPS